MSNARSVLSAARELGVEIPKNVTQAVDRSKAVRALNPGTPPLRTFARRVLEAADLDKALVEQTARLAAENERARLLSMVRSEAERDVEAAILAEKSAIVAGFLSAPSIVEAGRLLAQVAPALPRDVPRSPSIERDGAERVVRVARVVEAWQAVEKIARSLAGARLIPTATGANMTSSLLLLDVDALDTSDALAWTNALHLAASGHASPFGASMHLADDARAERLVPVTLAHTGPISLATSAEEYVARFEAYREARATVVARREYEQPRESWVPNLGGASDAGVVVL